MNNRLDRIMERLSRTAARGMSRRSFFGRASAFGIAAASMPLLPVSRANAAQQPGESGEAFAHRTIALLVDAYDGVNGLGV